MLIQWCYFGRNRYLRLFPGDAIKYLEDCCVEKRQFDHIFGDLTDVPIDTDTEGDNQIIFYMKVWQPQIITWSLQRQSCGTSFHVFCVWHWHVSRLAASTWVTWLARHFRLWWTTSGLGYKTWPGHLEETLTSDLVKLLSHPLWRFGFLSKLLLKHKTEMLKYKDKSNSFEKKFKVTLIFQIGKVLQYCRYFPWGVNSWAWLHKIFRILISHIWPQGDYSYSL